MGFYFQTDLEEIPSKCSLASHASKYEKIIWVYWLYASLVTCVYLLYANKHL